MEYKCSICEKDLIEPTSNKAGLIAHTFRDKYYCNECVDAAEFADMVSQPNKVKEKKIKQEGKENKNELSASVIVFRCVKCKNESTGNKCIHCATPSPLMGRKKI
jgi:hypothetical protein